MAAKRAVHAARAAASNHEPGDEDDLDLKSALDGAVEFLDNHGGPKPLICGLQRWAAKLTDGMSSLQLRPNQVMLPAGLHRADASVQTQSDVTDASEQTQSHAADASVQTQSDVAAQVKDSVVANPGFLREPATSQGVHDLATEQGMQETLAERIAPPLDFLPLTGGRSPLRTLPPKL